MSKTIIITGASRGIGLAITHHLLSSPQQHNLILVARSRSALEAVQSEAPARISILSGDFSDFSLGQKAVDLALSEYGSLDALVLNHGTLGEVKRVVDSDPAGWRETFDVNFFSFVACVKAALQPLRKSHGRIIFTSSGAALSAYSTWGAYGASKAALNHFALTLKSEEPDITTVSIRPGVVDSEMQREIREVHHATMDEKDQEKFILAKQQGTLLRPEQPGNVIARLAVAAGKELSGKFLSWNDEALEGFQD